MKVSAYVCRVVGHRWTNRRYKHLKLSCPEPIAERTSPGQFYQIACPVDEVNAPFLRRPMSVYGIGPDPETIEFLYKVTGVGTQALERLAVGESLTIIGPLGVGFSFSSRWRRVLFLARGVGMATLAPLVPLAAEAGVDITAVLSARSAEDLMRDEFLRGRRADLHVVLDSEGNSAVDHMAPMINRLLERDRPDMVYTCGSNRLLTLLQKLEVKGEVALEQQMACGMGVCLSCVRPFKHEGKHCFQRVCCDGPVFPLNTVAGEIPFA